MLIKPSPNEEEEIHTRLKHNSVILEMRDDFPFCPVELIGSGASGDDQRQNIKKIWNSMKVSRDFFHGSFTKVSISSWREGTIARQVQPPLRRHDGAPSILSCIQRPVPFFSCRSITEAKNTTIAKCNELSRSAMLLVLY